MSCGVDLVAFFPRFQPPADAVPRRHPSIVVKELIGAIFHLLAVPVEEVIHSGANFADFYFYLHGCHVVKCIAALLVEACFGGHQYVQIICQWRKIRFTFI